MLPEWAALPVDVLEEISMRLSSWDDNTRFRSVCTSWRSAAPKRPHLPLLLTVCGSGETHCFKYCNFPNDAEFLNSPKLPRDVTEGRHYCCSDYGWIVLVGYGPRRPVSLFNPSTEAHIILPDLNTEWGKEVFKLVFSCDPALDPNQCIIMAICTTNLILHCRPGDSCWTPAIYPECVNESIDDIIFYNGEFYAVSTSYRVFVCQIVLDDSQNPPASPPGPLFFRSRRQQWHRDPEVYDFDDDHWCGLRCYCIRERTCKYLVKSSDDLLLVATNYYDHKVTGSGCEVFRVELDDGQTKLFQQENLDGRALFIGYTSTSLSVSIDNTSPPWCKRNCIYYSGLEPLIIMFDMEAGKISFMTDEYFLQLRWFTPSIY